MEANLVTRPDGRVVLTIGSDKFRLRRIKLGEYRDLMEQLEHLDDEIDLGANAPDLVLSRSLYAEGWVRTVVAVLCGRQLPSPEQLPAWVASPGFAHALVRLWQTRPFSPWKPLEPGQSGGQAADGADFGVLGEVAHLYRVLNQFYIDPLRADEMELWQIAAVLEQDEAPTPMGFEGLVGRGTGGKKPRDFVAERMAAHREGRTFTIDDAEVDVTPAGALGIFGVSPP